MRPGHVSSKGLKNHTQKGADENFCVWSDGVFLVPEFLRSFEEPEVAFICDSMFAFVDALPCMQSFYYVRT